MIPISQPKISARAKKYILECLKENRLSNGPFNRKFEKQFSDFLGCKFASSCSNGTVALYLALKACGIEPGDEVLMPTLTFAATASAVIQAGAIPVFVDIDPSDWNISASDLEKNISPKTKAILVVHLYGVPSRMKEIMKIAKKYKLKVIEDTAEALGSSIGNKKMGTFGDVGCFSFYANKVITTGEGGMCVTNNKKIYDTLEVVKSHGTSKKRYWHLMPATNARMTNFQAAIGLSQMEEFSQIMSKRKQIYINYKKLLSDDQRIILQPGFEGEEVSPWIFTIRVPGINKEKLVDRMEKMGIETRPGFYPCHVMPAFSKFHKKGQKFPIAEEISKDIINLPTYTDLSLSDIRTVVSSLKQVLNESAL